MEIFKRIALILFFSLLIIFPFNAQTIIKGKILNKKILEGNVELYAYKDFFTKNLFLLENSKLDSNNYEIKTSGIGETSKFQLKFQNITTDVFLEPNGKYIFNVSKKGFVVIEETVSDINKKINSFKADLSKYHYQHPTYNSGKDFPNFKYELSKKYGKIQPEFVRFYIKYRLAEQVQFYGGVQHSKLIKYDYERFIKSEKVLLVDKKQRWNNPAYVEYLSSHIGGLQICELKVKNKCEDSTLSPLEKLYGEAQRLKNKELIQMAVLLYIKNKILRKEAIKEESVLFDMLSNYSESVIIRKVGSEYLKKFKSK